MVTRVRGGPTPSAWCKDLTKPSACLACTDRTAGWNCKKSRRSSLVERCPRKGHQKTVCWDDFISTPLPLLFQHFSESLYWGQGGGAVVAGIFTKQNCSRLSGLEIFEFLTSSDHRGQAYPTVTPWGAGWSRPKHSFSFLHTNITMKGNYPCGLDTELRTRQEAGLWGGPAPHQHLSETDQSLFLRPAHLARVRQGGLGDQMLNKSEQWARPRRLWVEGRGEGSTSSHSHPGCGLRGAQPLGSVGPFGNWWVLRLKSPK